MLSTVLRIETFFVQYYYSSVLILSRVIDFGLSFCNGAEIASLALGKLQR